LGYCLNYFGRFGEAEKYCRSAININPNRFNAYKNLGVALTGLGQHADAARNFMKATLSNPKDVRALKLLEELFANQKEVADEISDIETKIQKCRDAVKTASEISKMMRSQ